MRAVVNYRKLGGLVLAAVVLYNEFFGYYSKCSSWPQDPASSETLSVLFVADPQIQGLEGEPGFPFGMITRWDSDRFLSKTFGWAMYYYKVDVIVFLGDLVDEGQLINITIIWWRSLDNRWRNGLNR